MKKPDKFVGYALIALGVLGAIVKFRTHQEDWRPGVIVKLLLIIGALAYGLWIVIGKNNKKDE